jgi:hypothetical protein
MSDKTYMELEADNTYLNEQNGRLFEQCVDLRDKLAAREAELARARTERNRFQREAFEFQKKYEDVRTWEKTAKDTAVLLRDAESDIEARDARITELKTTVLACVAKVKYGLGAGGQGSGMYAEVELGGAICDAITDGIEEEFEALSGKENGNESID